MAPFFSSQVQNEYPFYIHCFDTAQSEYTRAFPSPRREYTEYQKYATTFPNALYKYIIWEWAPCGSYYDLVYKPPKHYKVFSLHRAEDVKWSKSEKYQGDLIPVTEFFSLLCKGDKTSEFKNDKTIKIISETKVSKKVSRIEVQVPAEIAFNLALASAYQCLAIPNIEKIKRLPLKTEVETKAKTKPGAKTFMPNLVWFIIFSFFFLALL